LSVTKVLGTTSPAIRIGQVLQQRWPGQQPLGLGDGELDGVIASCWFAVGDQCQPNSYFDQ
jgi:hypothetical protein